MQRAKRTVRSEKKGSGSLFGAGSLPHGHHYPLDGTSNRPQTPEEWEAVRRSVLRGAPYGSEPWQKQTAVAVRLQSLLRPRGRVRQTKDDAREMK
jgi:hypothetical protein